MKSSDWVHPHLKNSEELYIGAMGLEFSLVSILNPKVGPISRLVTTYYPFSRFQFSTFFIFTYSIFRVFAFYCYSRVYKVKKINSYDKADILINIRCNQIWPKLATCQILHIWVQCWLFGMFTIGNVKMFVINIGGTRLELKGTTAHMGTIAIDPSIG